MEQHEKIMAGDALLAVVLRHGNTPPGCSFFTPPDFPLQLGAHRRRAGDTVQAHEHTPFSELKDLPAQEFFYIEKGKVKVGLYHDGKAHSDVTLREGDMIVLNCAHDVTFLEDTTMIELKQGPYRGKEKEKRYLYER